MGKRSRALAERFQRAIAEFSATVEDCSDAHWQAMCKDEGWSVAATAHHIVAVFPIEASLIRTVAEGGEPPSLTWEGINEMNTRHAQQYAACNRAELLALLRREAPTMAELVRGLSDDQLDRTAVIPVLGDAPVSTQQLIEGGVLIDHVEGHLRSIRAAV